MVSPKFYKINSLKSLFHETSLTSTFSERRLPERITLRPDDLRSCKVPAQRYTYGGRPHHVFIGIQGLHHEISSLEARKVTKLHYRDLTSSNDEFSSYAQSIILISTGSTPPPVINETLDLYPKRVTLSKFICEGRPTTTKPTFVVLRAK